MGSCDTGGDPALDHAKVEQTITALASGAAHTNTVDARKPGFVLRHVTPGTRLLASFVNAWQCRRTSAGPVLVLLYGCQINVPEEPPPDLCAPSDERERYLSSAGKPLDQDFSFDHQRYAALRATLGYQDGAS